MTPSEHTVRTRRGAKIAVCAVLALGALRLTVLKPAAGGPAGDTGLAPAGVTSSTEPGPIVTSPPIELERDPFLPVDG